MFTCAKTVMKLRFRCTASYRARRMASLVLHRKQDTSETSTASQKHTSSPKLLFKNQEPHKHMDA